MYFNEDRLIKLLEENIKNTKSNNKNKALENLKTLFIYGDITEEDYNVQKRNGHM